MSFVPLYRITNRSDGGVDADRTSARLPGGGAPVRRLAVHHAFPRPLAGGAPHDAYRRHAIDPGAGGAFAGRARR